MEQPHSREKFAVESLETANLLFGYQNKFLKLIEKMLDVQIGCRGTMLNIEGDPQQVAITRRLLEELSVLLREGYTLYSTDIDYAVRILSADSKVSLKNIFQ